MKSYRYTCYRCGKHLCTEQSLNYHLQKRVRCTEYKCTICNKQHTRWNAKEICEKICGDEIAKSQGGVKKILM
jgi:hypothetical protein